MAAWIKMESTVTKTWSILDITALCYPFHPIHLGCALNLSRQELHEALHTIEGALGGLRLDDYTLSGYGKAITFLGNFQQRRNLDRDIPLLSAYRYLITSRSLQLVRHVLGDISAFSRLVSDDHLLRQFELTFLYLGLHRYRDNIDIGSRCRSGDSTQHRCASYERA